MYMCFLPFLLEHALAWASLSLSLASFRKRGSPICCMVCVYIYATYTYTLGYAPIPDRICDWYRGFTGVQRSPPLFSLNYRYRFHVLGNRYLIFLFSFYYRYAKSELEGESDRDAIRFGYIVLQYLDIYYGSIAIAISDCSWWTVAHNRAILLFGFEIVGVVAERRFWRIKLLIRWTSVTSNRDVNRSILRSTTLSCWKNRMQFRSEWFVKIISDNNAVCLKICFFV